MTTMFMRKVEVKDGKANYVPATINERGKGVLANWIDEAPKGARTIVKLCPVEYLAFDSRIQIEDRVERSKAKLIANFDDNKMTVLTGVIHEEEGLISIVDGVGRLTATQIIDPEKYNKLEVQILLKAPKDPEERTIFEADVYETQDDNKAKVTDLQKHGARMLRKDPAALIMDSIRAKYGISYVSSHKTYMADSQFVYGNLYRIAKTLKGGDALEFVMNVMKASRFMNKPYGRPRYITKALYNIYIWYEDDKETIGRYLSNYLRPLSAAYIKAKAVSRYPMLSTESAVSIFFEDLVVDNLNLSHRHMINKEGKIVDIPA